MFLLNNTNYKYSNSHFHKALDESGKETFTKALTDFCESFSKKKQNSQNWEFRKCVSSF